MRFQDKLLDWLVPALLAVASWHLKCISDEMKDMGRTLAVAVERVEQHERRISHLERSGP